MASSLALVAVLVGCGGTDVFGGPEDGPGSDGGPGTSGGCDQANEAEVLRLANQARAAEGIGDFGCDAALTMVARAHSEDMCQRAFFSHRNPDGEDPFERMRAAGIRYSAAAENIAQGQTSARQVHDAWMGSSGHRRNILNGRYGRMGVGYVACGGSRQHYWTQVFTN